MSTHSAREPCTHRRSRQPKQRSPAVSEGEQLPVADATVAVDSLNVDWNAQAVRSANSYIEMSPFSCQGLIDQLSSEYGDQYTVAEATYAAGQVGLC